MQILLKNWPVFHWPRVSHFFIYQAPEKAKQPSKDTNKMFLEYVCLRLWEGKLYLFYLANINST